MLRAQLAGAVGIASQEVTMLLAQLIDADALKTLSAEELREMILKLDDEVVYGDETIEVRGTTANLAISE
jgi:hypothetical protein